MEDISAGYSLTTIQTMIETSVSEGTPHTPHPATAAAPTALWLMDTPTLTCAMKSTSIVVPHPSLTTPPADITHATLQTGASLTPVTPIALHRKHCQVRPSCVQDLQPSP